MKRRANRQSRACLTLTTQVRGTFHLLHNKIILCANDEACISTDAFDHDLMLKCLQDIREGKSTQVPVYDFKSNARIEGKFDTIRPSDVVLLEGILVFYLKDVREMFDMKLFVDTDADTRLARRGT
jgi:uridine kinase